MDKNILLFKTLCLHIFIFLICQSVFLMAPKQIFAQSYQLPPDYVQNQVEQTQGSIDKYIDSQYAKYNLNAPTPSSIPFITPKTSIDYQELQLLHQVQSGKMPLFNAYLLRELLKFPFLPIQTKLNLYYFFSSLPFVSSIHLSTV